MTFATIAWYTLPILLIAVMLIFMRLVRGPSLPDRVVALDILSAVGIVIIAVYAMATNQAVFLDVALILALISFLGTVAFAFYIDQR
ncbi:MAG: pesticidal protein Cry22Aa [Anaerolineales bacterium]|nr:pesticidal protein Cry22Aa [Anaerolineales bacterium]